MLGQVLLIAGLLLAILALAALAAWLGTGAPPDDDEYTEGDD